MLVKSIQRSFLIFSIVSLQTVGAQTVNANYVDGAIYLKIADSCTQELTPSSPTFARLSHLFSVYQVTEVLSPFKGLNTGLDHTYRIHFDSKSLVDEFIAEASDISYVEYTEKVPLIRISYTPNDLQAVQWHLAKINAELGWDYSIGDSEVIIAIVDNAVSTIHEDLIGNMYINPGEIPGNGIDDDLNGFVDDVTGFDVAELDNDPNPPAGSTSSDPWIHGTHCAGIASASSNNNVGIAGLGFNCAIVPVKSAPDGGDGQVLTYAYEGISYAVKVGVDVISMSFGTGSSIVAQTLIAEASSQGIILVGAAGNDNSDQAQFPGSYSQVINVGATNQNDQKANFSNYGPSVDVMAPGVGIYSTLSGGVSEYGSLNGTSMSCPLVAGLCGLLLAQDPSRTDDDVRALLESGCENIDAENPNYVGQIGAGRINAYNSLRVLNVDAYQPNAIEVFPNPFNNVLTIHSSNGESIEVRAYNSVGKLVYSGALKGNATIGSDWSPGVYNVVLQGDNLHQIIRVVKS